MKKVFDTRRCILLIASFFGTAINIAAQDSSAGEPSVNLRYFINNNNIQYLMIQSRIKLGKKFQPLPKQAVRLYLDSNDAAYLIVKTYTDEKGFAKVIIPPSLKDKWNSNPGHQFIGILEATAKQAEITTTLDITKAKIEMDTSTADAVHSIRVKVKSFRNNEWVPAKDVEMKIGVSRSAGSILSAGDEATYTTDSTGGTTVEFKKNNLPGDQQGNFILAASVEDNDEYGNLLVEKTVPWGMAVKYDKHFFDQRTLWSTRFRTPPWLLLMAYSIVISVWGTIIFLVLQIVKIKKLGTAAK